MITLIQTLIFVSYIGFLLVKFKRPLSSISDSWYKLDGNLKHLFTAFCWSLGFLQLFQTDGSSGFFFLAGAGLIFTGAATAFKESMTGTIHFIGAYTCIISSLVALIVERNNYIPAILFGIVAIILYALKIKNRTWWVEIAAFACILIGLC